MANKALLGVIAGLTAVASAGSYLAVTALPSMDPAPTLMQDESPSAPTDTPAPPTQTATMPSIEGAWILAKWGGEDGLSRCRDYANPALYKRNDDMGEVAQFTADGSYRSYFAYTTPSGEEHYTHYSASWQQERSKLVLLNFVAEDAFRNESPREDRSMVFKGSNVVMIDDRRYVRCIGDTGLDDGQ